MESGKMFGGAVRTVNVDRESEANKLSVDTGIGGTRIATARESLGALLRRLRQRARPAPNRRASRRRVAGLRREEVALEAGISVTWYTWLEQGRPVRVSPSTLLEIARALGADETERDHLLRLGVASSAPVRPSFASAATTHIREFADGLRPHPAYAVNGRWDVLYANEPAHRIFGDFNAQPGVTDNVLRRLCVDPAWRALFEDWEDIVASAVAQFRASTGHFAGDPEWDAFVAQLQTESSVFAGHWSRQELAASHPRHKVLRHAELGRLAFTYASVALDAGPDDVRVVIYTPHE